MSKNTVKNEGALSADTRKILNDNTSDVSVASATFSATSGDTSTTLTNVAGLVTGTLEAGTYRFRIHLAGVATANSGLKVGLKQGTASMLTSIESIARGFTASAVAVQHSTTATDAASLFASTSAVINCIIEGTVVVATAGTLQVQAAQNASHADTTSVYLGSYMTFTKVV
jgi:hypothetical protein